MAKEINLVPDIKNDMIKALKLRNFIFFICIVVASGSAIVTFIFGTIAGGQQLARDSKKTFIDELSSKISQYSDLSDTLTIKDQVGNIDILTDNKQVFSRTFNALAAMIPTGADSIRISELRVDLGNTEDGASQPTFSIEAQANAGKEPFIDYNVLDSFKKSMQYMRYDYGDFVDREGNIIPAYCIIGQNSDGATFKENKDGKDNYYAYWTINGKGCNPSERLKPEDYQDVTESYDNQTVVRIWRTPQYTDWYKSEYAEDQPYMGLNGNIENIEHFNSKCITYTGELIGESTTPKWTTENTCRLITDESGETEGDNEGIVGDIESSNGRDNSGELVLRFEMTIRLNPEFYKFTNSNMLAIAPSGRRNVTDSYSQVQAMFGERAVDCGPDDIDCNSDGNTSTDSTTNTNKVNSSNNSTRSSSSNANSNSTSNSSDATVFSSPSSTNTNTSTNSSPRINNINIEE